MQFFLISLIITIASSLAWIWMSKTLSLKETINAAYFNQVPKRVVITFYIFVLSIIVTLIAALIWIIQKGGCGKARFMASRSRVPA